MWSVFKLCEIHCFGGGGTSNQSAIGILDVPLGTAEIHKELESWVNLGSASTGLTQVTNSQGNLDVGNSNQWTASRFLNAMLGENPWHNQFGTISGVQHNAFLDNPAQKIALMQTDLAVIKDLISPVSTQVTQWNDERDKNKDDWDDISDRVIAYVDGQSVYASESATVETLKLEFERSIQPDHFRSVNRLAMSAVTNNAVNSSTMILGQSILEDSHNSRVAQFESQLKVQLQNINTQHRHQFILNGVEHITRTLYNKLGMFSQSVQSALDVHRMDVVSTREYNEDFNSSLVKDRSWGMDAIQETTGVIAGMQGASGSGNTGRELTRTQSALSGALSGAVAGAQLSRGNPIGVGVGAAIGLVGGIFGGNSN